MKAKNLLITYLTFVFCCFATYATADDISEGISHSAILESTVNINQADAETIAAALDGIGMSRALAIVQYRDDHGSFYSAEELSAVKGIGITTVERNTNRKTWQARLARSTARPRRC